MSEPEWVCFTRRTNNLKLRFLRNELDKHGIANRLHGKSAHAPRLEVHAEQLDAAWIILDQIGDDVPDDDPRFTECSEDCTGCENCYEDDDPANMGWIGRDGRP